MTAKTIWRVDVGDSGYKPGTVKIHAAATDTFSIVTAAGYITAQEQQVWNLQKSDIVEVFYHNDTVGQFQPSISSGVVTLNSLSGTVSGSTTVGDFAVFSDTVGGLIDSGFSPTDATKAKVVMMNGTSTSGNIVVFSDAAGTASNGPVAGNKVLTSGITTPDVGANLITVDVVCGQAALASAGSVTLQASSGSKQYKIRNAFLNKVGTNFSGGGGDRLGQITDGTSVFSVIPAATLQTLTNSVWGSTALPAPVSVSYNTSSVAGAPIVFKYSGGTTDYTAGSLTLTLLVERVA